MLRLRNVKMGEKFVMSHEAGVWKKVASNRARCVFGPEDVFGKECDTSPDVSVFVIPREHAKPMAGPEKRSVVEGDGLFGVVLIDSEDKVVHQTRVTNSVASICAGAGRVRIMLPRKKKPTVFSVVDSGYDFVEGSLLLEVHE